MKSDYRYSWRYEFLIFLMTPIIIFNLIFTESLDQSPRCKRQP